MRRESPRWLFISSKPFPQSARTDVAPDTSPFLVAWMNFMNGGGRLALSIAAALAAAGLVRMLAARLVRIRGAV